MSRFLLQMAGESGTGKSTLALAVGCETGAVVIDKDVIKSRLLEGEADRDLDGLPESIAAPFAYAVLFDIARSFLQQGLSVVIDATAFYPIIRERGRALAEATGASYFIIDCSLTDIDALQARIDSKQLMASQPRVASLDGYTKPGTAPLIEPHLRIDTQRPSEEYLAKALAYIGYDAG